MRRRTKSDPERATRSDSDREERLAAAVRRGMILCAAATIVLIVFSVIRAPGLSLGTPGMQRSFGAGIGIAILYASVGWFVPRAAWLYATLACSARGCCFGLGRPAPSSRSPCSGSISYPHTERQNLILALSTFGLFFLLLLVGRRISRHPDDPSPRVGTPGRCLGLHSSASQLWLILLLLTYHLFQGTPQEGLVSWRPTR